jgi:hypothetical protein
MIRLPKVEIPPLAILQTLQWKHDEIWRTGYLRNRDDDDKPAPSLQV